jgi:Ca2+-binding RTX toxin-like protein
MRGSAGADHYDGSSGIDTVDYSFAPSPGESTVYVGPFPLLTISGVSVFLDGGDPGYGDSAGDTFSRVENIVGSAYADWLGGNSGDNLIVGNAGNDLILGGTADAAGNDTLVGGEGNDTLGGGDGNDVFVGGAGADSIVGGGGIDTLDFSAATSPGTVNYFGINLSGVFVDLSSGTGLYGESEGDTYNDIENVVGSTYDDVIGGDDDINTISGNNGNDVIHGGDGGDTLDGGAGTDWLSYSGSDAAVDVNLAINTASSGDADGDQISGFENLVGSQFNDTLYGSDTDDNTLRGGFGSDLVNGFDGNDTLAGEAGNDTLVGGRGDDELNGGSGNDTMNGGLGNDTFRFGYDAGDDFVLGFTVGTDRIAFDSLTAQSLADLEFIQGSNNTLILYDDGTEESAIVLYGIDVETVLANADDIFQFA